MIKKANIFILFILLFLVHVIVLGQTKIQVVTHTIQKSFAYKPACVVNINAEKAKIQIRKSTNNNINIKLSLISKNPSLDLAETDLKYCDYQINEKDNGISIINFFKTNNDYKEITSNLSAKLEIEVPTGINIKLKDIYGDVDIEGINGIFNIVADFGLVKFSEISGNLYISSNCSDIIGNSSDAIVNMTAQKADIDLNDINNTLTIKNKYGNIELNNVQASLIIDGEMTAVTFIADNFKNFSFDCTAIDGEIEVPNDNVLFISKKSGKTSLNTNNGNIAIKIKTTYNSIILKPR
jgi:hypothetical protein